MSDMHQRLPANTLGRDFVVGDLHGCLQLLRSKLVGIGFNPDQDRLFSVGDLADRGPDSLGCLRLLREPWFYAVAGNHEDMLLSYFYLRDTVCHRPDSIFHNGGDWLTTITPEERDELENDLLPRVLALPYVITVGQEQASFHVAHAELMVSLDAISSDPTGQVAAELTWSRRLIRQVTSETWAERRTPHGTLIMSHQPWEPNHALTFVGHTPLKMLVMHRSHLFIDGGAYAHQDEKHLHVVDVEDARTWVS
ncbi:metallophosphoesterase [Advenella kashmirensis W13003]|uniref:Metallophosphoesterase n=1 Tax=Advenella kashmirensis W13003 TaxID=1424334 RepID=V8QUQ9_9BURK|nr:metallophosphoesterase [Advenella kashmirensis]ETF03025.1 metallophosphoesterase [Advenella kashmirensis W13003]